MKASTQYNDFTGTSAADISDHTNLEKYLSAHGIDTDKYQAVGASFYAGYADYFTASIICLDKQRSTRDKPQLVKIIFADKLSQKQFFSLFKRMEVVFSIHASDFAEGYRLAEPEEIFLDDLRAEQDS